jgi:CRP-like cAMP-binding protein
MQVADPLVGISLFNGLTPEEFNKLSRMMKKASAQEGSCLFLEDEPGEILYVIVSGAVELRYRLAEGVDRPFLTLEEGEVFGEMALVDPGPRSASAHVVRAGRFLLLERKDFLDLVSAEQTLGLKVFLNLAIVLTERLRRTNEGHRQAMRWGLQVSGATQLGFHRLISERAAVRLELISGQKVEGVLLKVERTPSEHELTILDSDHQLCVVPYRAVATVRFPGGDALCLK